MGVSEFSCYYLVGEIFSKGNRKEKQMKRSFTMSDPTRSDFGFFEIEELEPKIAPSSDAGFLD